MISPPTEKDLDLPHYLGELEGLSLEKVTRAVADKIEELEIRAICVKGPTECRDVGLLRFLFDLKELREFLHYHFPPVTVSRADLPAYRPLFDALGARGDWPERHMKVFSERKASYASFFESECEREANDAANPDTNET